ncbi:phospholipase [Rhizobium tubonense]|uniref:Phospholipase n=1 Tax=Rhizobium tubonense TaxID=484088 RepID=A0A2W4CVV3_9HYPH|nr:phospholipase [Rhizobium tubonense]
MVPSLNQRLVVFLHGIGGTGASMLPLASSWRPSLPRTAFAAPDAPFHHGNGYGHQWFGVDGNELNPERIEKVRKAFDDVADGIVRREGFEDRLDKVAFVGVSQGAIIALDAVGSGRWPVGALISFAGLLPLTSVTPAEKRTPILLVHGAVDNTIPSVASELAASQLRAAGFDVELKILPGVGHNISAEGAEMAKSFLIRTLS